MSYFYLPAVCLNAGRSLSSHSQVHTGKRSVSGHLPAFCSRLIAELLMLSIATCMTLKVRGRECFHTFSVHLLQTMGGKKKKKRNSQHCSFCMDSCWRCLFSNEPRVANMNQKDWEVRYWLVVLLTSWRIVMWEYQTLMGERHHLVRSGGLIPVIWCLEELQKNRLTLNIIM